MKELESYLEQRSSTWRASTFKTSQCRLKHMLAVSRELDPQILFNQMKKDKWALYTIKQTLIITAQFEQFSRGTARVASWLKQNAFTFRNCYATKSQFISEAQYQELLNKATQPGMYNMLVLMGEAGLRKSEALAARWDDFQDNVLTIVGKGGRTRYIPLSRSRLKEVVGSRICGDRNGCYFFFRRTPHTFHDLRAYFATKMLNTPGLNLRDVQLLLGHSSIKTTERYLRSDFERVKKVMVSL